jgi:hypothetical protein
MNKQITNVRNNYKTKMLIRPYAEGIILDANFVKEKSNVVIDSDKRLSFPISLPCYRLKLAPSA